MRIAKTIKRARGLRQSTNLPEKVAWETLRSLRDFGFPVRRQHPIGAYVVDFAVVSRQLVIEIDGGIHDLPEVAARDVLRQEEIEALGWRIVRVPTETALSRDHLLALICNALGI